MGTRVLQVTGASAQDLRRGIAAIQQEQGLSEEFPAEVQQAAEAAVRSPRLPERDLTDLDFVTIDPPGAMDLDQALHLEADGDGYVVHYAIADVMAFLEPGDPVDEEAHRRGESLYAPDSKIPLHPKVLSEAAASLVADRSALRSCGHLLDATGCWRGHRRAGSGVAKAAGLRGRARRSTVPRRVDAPAAQDGRRAADGEGGGARRDLAADPPRRSTSSTVGGAWSTARFCPRVLERADLADDGFAAAATMIEGEVGVLRTLPLAPEDAVKRLRCTARAWGSTGRRTRAIPVHPLARPGKPAEAAMVVACTTLLRGAGYAAFEGELPDQLEDAALALPYAHVTAPLRRLVDRYGLEGCAAFVRGSLCAMGARPAAGPARDHGRLGSQGPRLRERLLNLVEAETLAPRSTPSSTPW